MSGVVSSSTSPDYMTLAFLAVVPLVAAHLDKAFMSPQILNASPKFEIKYVDSLSPTEPVETVEMMLRGHRYSCQIPLNTVDQFDTLPIDEDKVMAQAVDVLNEKDWCRFKLDGYWGYRYCVGGDLLQFVPEWQSKEYFVISKKHYNYTLGQATDNVTLGRKNGLTYLKTEYANGTVCDLTGEPRKADIIYYCDTEAKEIIVKSIHEVASCEYEAYIARPELCSIPEFVLESRRNTINCVDLDMEYEEVVNEDQDETEEAQDQAQVADNLEVQDQAVFEPGVDRLADAENELTHDARPDAQPDARPEDPQPDDANPEDAHPKDIHSEDIHPEDIQPEDPQPQVIFREIQEPKDSESEVQVTESTLESNTQNESKHQADVNHDDP